MIEEHKVGFWTVTFTGLKKNVVPGVIITVTAFLIVVGYYTLHDFRAVLNHLAAFKMRQGYLYSVVATSIFGGVIPWSILTLQQQRKDSKVSDSHFPCFPSKLQWQELVFYALFFGYKGFQADLFFRLQSMVFGHSTRPLTIAGKVLADQFIANVFWFSPEATLMFRWKDNQFELQKTWNETFGDFINWFINSVVTTIISSWVVWIPSTSFIYSLPGSLQIPMFTLILLFYVLILCFVVKSSGEDR
eukprot:TRINITY_DN7634_c0_g1_i1.p1 TRINITY_DN7634_c0_g1~~TRINITY_DN7634_c0_g1_i1.p1  ORF type:complete len:246 (-),score=23.09 TRINITY_DN7634_c0_g1_i1:24-761(-)